VERVRDEDAAAAEVVPAAARDRGELGGAVGAVIEGEAGAARVAGGELARAATTRARIAAEGSPGVAARRSAIETGWT